MNITDYFTLHSEICGVSYSHLSGFRKLRPLRSLFLVYLSAAEHTTVIEGSGWELVQKKNDFTAIWYKHMF